MSLHRKIKTKAHSKPQSPRLSSTTKNKGSVRHSFQLSPRGLNVDRNFNVSPATDRSSQSPRILNSNRQSHRQTITQGLNRSMIENLNEAHSSYLDTSYQSIGMQNSSSNQVSGRSSIKKLKLNSLVNK